MPGQRLPKAWTTVANTWATVAQRLGNGCSRIGKTLSTHWANDAAQRLLRRLALRIPALAVGVAGAARAVAAAAGAAFANVAAA